MIIYLIVIFLCIHGILAYDKGRINEGYTLYIFILFYLSIIIGLFSPIGGDCIAYRYEFKYLPTLDELNFNNLYIGGRRQPFWLYFNAFTKKIANDFNVYLFIHSLIINTIIFYTINKYTKYKFTALLVFIFTFKFFMFNIEIQRESLAVCVWLLIIKYLKSGEWIKYYIGCIIAFLIHASATFLFLLPLIFYLLKFKHKSLFFIIYGALILFLSLIGSYIENVVNLFNYQVVEGVADQFQYYDGLSKNITNLIISAIARSTPPIIFIIIAERCRYSKTFLIDCAYIFILITVCTTFVTALGRFNNYIIILYFAFVADMIQCYITKYRVAICIALLCMCINVTYLFTRPLAYFNGKLQYYELFIPYRSILD